MAKQRLLIVDSDARSLRVLEVSLRKAGYNVTTAVDGLDALAKVKTEPPDLIISDTSMPEMDGYAFAKEVRSNADWEAIPFIFLSRRTTIEDKIRGLEIGVDDFLTKPIFVKEIVTRVRMLLQRQARESLERRSLVRTSFAGSLEDMTVIDLLQTIDISRKSGVLHLTGESKAGRVYFRDGKVIDGEFVSLRAEEAIYRFLTWSVGSFQFEFREVRRQDKIPQPTQGLLMEGMRRVDEWGRLLEGLPPLETCFEVDYHELAEQLADIPDEVNQILRLFDGSTSILEVVDESGMDDLDALATISKLFFDGLVFDPKADGETPGHGGAMGPGDDGEGAFSAPAAPVTEPRGPERPVSAELPQELETEEEPPETPEPKKKPEGKAKSDETAVQKATPKKEKDRAVAEDRKKKTEPEEDEPEEDEPDAKQPTPAPAPDEDRQADGEDSDEQETEAQESNDEEDSDVETAPIVKVPPYDKSDGSGTKKKGKPAVIEEPPRKPTLSGIPPAKHPRKEAPKEADEDQDASQDGDEKPDEIEESAPPRKKGKKQGRGKGKKKRKGKGKSPAVEDGRGPAEPEEPEEDEPEEDEPEKGVPEKDESKAKPRKKDDHDDSRRDDSMRDHDFFKAPEADGEYDTFEDLDEVGMEPASRGPVLLVVLLALVAIAGGIGVFAWRYMDPSREYEAIGSGVAPSPSTRDADETDRHTETVDAPSEPTTEVEGGTAHAGDGAPTEVDAQSPSGDAGTSTAEAGAPPGDAGQPPVDEPTEPERTEPTPAQIREARTLANRAAMMVESRPEEALELAQEAVQLDPELTTAWLVIGYAEQQGNDLVAARRAYERCQEATRGAARRDCRDMMSRLE